MIIYNKENGLIISQIPDEQNIESFFIHFDDNFKNNLGVIYEELDRHELNRYKIVNEKLMELSNVESFELSKYGRILSGSERVEIDLLKKITPTDDEITKSETIIDVLELMVEVLE